MNEYRTKPKINIDLTLTKAKPYAFQNINDLQKMGSFKVPSSQSLL